MALSAAIRTVLEKRFTRSVRFDEPMSAHTSLRVGGPADALVAPQSVGDLIALMRLVTAEGIDWYILGGGTNLLVRDKGIRGVVISLAEGFCGIHRVAGDRIHAESGARLSAICRFANEHGLAGMDFATGIPGTIGGAAVMNAGTAAGDMAGVIDALEILHPPDRIETIGRHQLDYRYRGLNGMPVAGGSSPILLSVTLQLRCGDSGRLKAVAEDCMSRRRATQPAGFSAGCFFKNPGPDLSAGELIDRAGLKGDAVGDAVVSDKHANFIVNRGGARAEDLLCLMERIQTRVHNTFEVSLEPEVRIVGEK